jgi:hypothetical protein
VEESVRWRNESPLIKCYKGHHVSLHGRGGHGVPRHIEGHELHRHHKPLIHEALQVTMHNLGRGPVLFRHG